MLVWKTQCSIPPSPLETKSPKGSEENEKLTDCRVVYCHISPKNIILTINPALNMYTGHHDVKCLN